jgi:hypothetical protein
MLACC